MSSSSFQIGPSGANPRLSTLLLELEMARLYTQSIVRDLSAEELAAVPTGGKNSIGSVLSHIAVAEGLMRRITTGAEPFPVGTEVERQTFGFEVDPLAGSELGAYLDQLEASRQQSRELFAARDDAWLDTPRTFLRNPGNYHYYWFHVLLDEARHQGQIILLRKYLLNGADVEFDPYIGLAAKE